MTGAALLPPCDHQWQRLPVLDFSVSYKCSACEHRVQFGWGSFAGRTFEDVDRAFMAEYGGVVTGELDPENEMANRALRKAAEILGFDFDAEEENG